MRRLIFILFFISGSAWGATTTDKLTITGQNISINGTTYKWNAGVGSNGQCLMTDGSGPIPTLTWGNCSGGGTPATTYVLLEDSTVLILEDGTKTLLE